MWSRKYSACIKCGSTKLKHVAKGLCRKCHSYNYQHNPHNIQQVLKAKKKWYANNMSSEKLRELNNQRYFDGHRYEVLERDGWQCAECGENRKDQLVVHHIDNSGRDTIKSNNNPNNLITLCRACHARIHATTGRWSKNYDACKNCGTTKYKHNAKGFCTSCYSKLHRLEIALGEVIRKERGDTNKDTVKK